MKKGGCITFIHSDTAVPEMRAFGWPEFFFFFTNNIKIHSFTSLTEGGGGGSSRKFW